MSNKINLTFGEIIQKILVSAILSGIIVYLMKDHSFNTFDVLKKDIFLIVTTLAGVGLLNPISFSKNQIENLKLQINSPVKLGALFGDMLWEQIMISIIDSVILTGMIIFLLPKLSYQAYANSNLFAVFTIFAMIIFTASMVGFAFLVMILKNKNLAAIIPIVFAMQFLFSNGVMDINDDLSKTISNAVFSEQGFYALARLFNIGVYSAKIHNPYELDASLVIRNAMSLVIISVLVFLFSLVIPAEKKK